MPAMIDPSKPTREEMIAHNMMIAKANLASNLAEKLCSDLPYEEGNSRHMTAKEVAEFSISVAETIIESYSLMPDAAGNKGGIVS